MKQQTVLVTGATGFIGREVCACLAERGLNVRAATRKATDDSFVSAMSCEHQQRVAYASKPLTGASVFDIVSVHQPLDAPASWRPACTGADAIIHLAGRAHILNETATDPLAEFRAANRDVSIALAKAAIENGVGRMIFVSSIGVYGISSGSQPMRETDRPQPHDAYSQSKLEAEKALFDVADGSPLEMVVVRPPLVYGGDAKGNFHRLLKLVDRGWPIPLASVRNARSMIGVRNLADALVTCTLHPNAGGEIFLVSDGADWSTPELIRRIAAAMGKRARLLPAPPMLLKLAGRMTGQSRALARLCGSLQIDDGKIRRMLDWSPPLRTDVGVQSAVAQYLRHGK